MALNFEDLVLRQSAFDHVRRLSEAGALTSEQLAAGFFHSDERIPLINPQRGIFKPRQMKFLLSIRTVFPRRGARVWYDDQKEVHQQIFAGKETVDYAFMGSDPDAADNRWLRDAMENQIPLIYFLGVSPGRYEALLPTFIVGWDAKALKARVAFSVVEYGETAAPENPAERRYALREVKQRLHQTVFREMVISAYEGRCALSGLPEPLLLDAAHIISDADERYGQPIITNGIPLSKMHHAAFDNHLIGVDPDYCIHVSEKLRSLNDGPTLEALKLLHQTTIRYPRREEDLPDRERLAMRFELFKAAQ
jgi:putative restriction endonuclease